MESRGSVSSCDSIASISQEEDERSRIGHNFLRIPAMTSSLIKRMSVKDKKPFRVAILGARSVGKSAMTVRVKTRKFIHSYAANVEMSWKFDMLVDGDPVTYEIRDTAALQTAANPRVEEHIRWADAFILLYSITDEESLKALVACKLLINLYAKRKKKSKGNVNSHSGLLVALVGNKNDLEHERMISEEQGRTFAEVNECSHFFELSTRESYDSVKTVFDNLYRAYRIRRSKSPQRPNAIEFLTKSTIPTFDAVTPTTPTSPSGESDLITAYKQRGRTKTTITVPTDPGLSAAGRLSPATFRKIAEERTSHSSSSPEEEHTFVGEEIVYQEPPVSPSIPKRRITVHSSPFSIRNLPSPRLLRKMHSEIRSQDSNNNNSQHKSLKVPVIKLPS